MGGKRRRKWQLKNAKSNSVLEILKIFAEEKGSMVIGGKVIEGVVNKGDKFEAMHRADHWKGGVKHCKR